MEAIINRIFKIMKTIFIITIIFLECCFIIPSYIFLGDIFILSTKIDKKYKLLFY